MGITLTASVPNDGVFFAGISGLISGELFSCTITFTNQNAEEPEPEIVPEPSQPKLRSTLSIDTFRSFAGSIVESFTGSSQPTPPADNLLKPRTFDNLTRTISMSGELQPVVEVLGNKIESIPEDGVLPPKYPSTLESKFKAKGIMHNDRAEEKEQLLPQENGGKLQLEKVQEKTVNKRQSTVFSGQNEIEQPAVFNKNPRGELKKETIAWAFAQSKIMYKTPGTTSANTYGAQNGLPLYNTPPTILFCDQEIPIGESRSFTYEIQLPSVLPPSHRGKLIRFTYKLIIGIQKSAVSRVTQVVTIPFRFFNRTNYDGSRPVFEILNPVISNKDESKVQSSTSSGVPSPVVAKPPSPGWRSAKSPHTSGLEMETSTIDNILNVLQISGKVSYDISKNNEHVCQLILPRLGYRLGESLTCLLNFSQSSLPCFHVSVFLETVETADPAFANKPKNQIQNHTKTCYVSLQWSVRFEFITGSGKRIQNTSNVVDGFVHSRAIPRADVEPFDCVVPLKVYGALKTTKQRRKHDTNSCATLPKMTREIDIQLEKTNWTLWKFRVLLLLKQEKLWDYSTQSVVKSAESKRFLFETLSPEFQQLTAEIQTGDLLWQFLLDYFQPQKPQVDNAKLEIIKKLCLFKSDNIIDYMNGLNEIVQAEKEFSFNLNELGIALALASLPPSFKNEIHTLESLDLESVCLQWSNAEQVLGKEIFSLVPNVTTAGNPLTAPAKSHGRQTPSGRETPSGRQTPTGRQTPRKIVNRNTPSMRIQEQRTNQPKLARFQMIAIKETFESFCKFGGGSDLKTMDGTRFAKFCKDCSITDSKLKQHQIDIIFNKIKSPKERRITQSQFIDGLVLIAESKYPEMGEFAFYQLFMDIFESGGAPKLSETKA
ncbi:hypothetical protein HDV01_003750 [Terramyces sp. JEL0728]|nr:hypothetical protein HDV01_003750 [Terramyces sp. JEL0728]